MNRIDFEKAKKIAGMLSGTEKPFPRETAAQKLLKIQTTMDLKRMKKSIMSDARTFIKNAVPGNGLETKSYLFYFKGKYYHVQGELKKLSESEVKKLLDETSKTKIFFICSGGGVCPMPGILSGKENMEAVEVKDDAAAAAFISEKSGIKVSVTDL